MGFDFGGFTELVDASNLKQKHTTVKNALRDSLEVFLSI